MKPVVVDTSVWSAALRRRQPVQSREVDLLRQLIEEGKPVALLGIVLQEVLQGFRAPEEGERLRRRLEAFPLVVASRADHELAARIHADCRRKGVAAGTVDCLIAASTTRRDAALLSLDADFGRIARVIDLRLA